MTYTAIENTRLASLSVCEQVEKVVTYNDGPLSFSIVLWIVRED